MSETRGSARDRALRSLAQVSCFPALPLQAARISERRAIAVRDRNVCGISFVVHRGVYDTGVDTELMAQAARILRGERFLEIGCGCGAIALLMAARCRAGVGADVSPAAVINSECNRKRLGISNVQFVLADVFDGVCGEFDVVLCNPPYNQHHAADVIERMFWDPEDSMKQRFFDQVPRFIRKNGRVYFGWADFPDLDAMLPINLAERSGLKYVRHYARPSGRGIHRFLVFEFSR